MPVFLLKRISFFHRGVSILLQNANGPCPIIGVANCLILEGRLVLNATCVEAGLIDDGDLLQLLSGAILDQKPAGNDGDKDASIEDQRMTVLNELPSMLRGLDLNIGFGGVDAMEFTACLTIFDLLGLDLYHGWCVDPAHEAHSVVSKITFNSAMEVLVDMSQQKDKPKENDSSRIRAEMVKQFIDETAMQITFHGLLQLLEKVRERQLLVLYRNQHFSTLMRYEGKLYTLVTDTGYAEMSAVVWETLDFDALNGDSTFVDSSFGVPGKKSSFAPAKSQSEDGGLPIYVSQSSHDSTPVRGGGRFSWNGDRRSSSRSDDSSSKCAVT
jgi:hypothetical protein